MENMKLEHELSRGIQVVNKAKELEEKENYSEAASKYKEARDIFKKISDIKLSAQCLTAYIVNMIKYYIGTRDIEHFSTNTISFYIKKLEGIKSLEFKKFEKYDILIKAYRELEKIFEDFHLNKFEDEMYYKRTSLYYKRHWDWVIQKDRKFINKLPGLFPFFKEFYLHKFCGHGEKPRRAVAWIIFIIFLFSVLFKCFNLIEFVDPEKTLCYWQSLYFSVITFTTLGYGDIVPVNTAGQITVIAEVTIGVLSLGLLLASLTRKFTK